MIQIPKLTIDCLKEGINVTGYEAWHTALKQYYIIMTRSHPVIENSINTTTGINHWFIYNNMDILLLYAGFSDDVILELSIRLMTWVHDLVEDADIGTFMYELPFGLERIGIEIGMNFDFEIKDYNDPLYNEESLLYDAYFEMYRDMYIKIYKHNPFYTAVPILMSSVSLADLYNFIGSLLNIVSETDWNASVLEQLDIMYTDLEEICIY